MLLDYFLHIVIRIVFRNTEVFRLGNFNSKIYTTYTNDIGVDQ